MALEDILLIESDIGEFIIEFPIGTLNRPQDMVSESALNELTII